MIEKANIKNLYRLSPLQGGMLFHALYDREDGSYFEQGIYSVDGPLDGDAFEQAWNAVVDRHDALRTAFVVKGVPEPLQVVLKKRPLDFRYRDISALSDDEAERDVAEYAAQDKERGFDPTRDPLLRIALFRRAEDRHVMVLSFHHIIMDGWCQGILAAEFTAIYTALREARPATLPPAPQYREYVRWLERQDKEKALAYWKEYLHGFDRPTHFPGREKGKEEAAPSGGQEQFRFSLTAQETAALKTFALRNGVTLNAVVQTLWGILLGKLNGSDDALFLGTVSGRPDDLENAGNIVGLFINALPVRVRFNDRERIADVAAAVRSNAGAAQPFQFAPLAEIQGSTPLKRDIANTLLVFENYPFAAAGDDAPLSFRQLAIDERTNYDVTVQVHPDEELGFGIAFDPEVIDPELVADACARLADAARLVAANPDAAVGDFAVEARTTEKEGGKPEADRAVPLDVAVAATFTVDPAIPALEWWLRRRGYAPSVKIAPYNQVFRELLDPSGTLAGTTGFGLLAVRFQDWIRDLADDDEAAILLHLERSFADYLQAIDRFPGSVPPVHLLLPENFSSFSPAVADKLRELQERIVQAAAERGNLFLLDARTLHADYGIADPFDPVADRAGHVPYRPEMNAAIGTAMARKVLARDQHPFKVIAVDCDNTLWKGICGEDGAAGVAVRDGHRALQQFLIDRSNEGFLIALCSKNNENDVWEVFEKNDGMLLKREQVTAHRINWQPKSGNLRSLADELNVGINSFIFIDDSGMECAEVRENAPDVLTLRLPDDDAAIPRFLRHIWSLDKWQVTDEDRKRGEMYAAERLRRQGEEQATSLEDFLAGLELKIVMAPVAPHQVPRVSQLTQRTNQFNTTTIRRDESEIRALIADDAWYCRVITVQDRFGEYGLVGVLLCRQEPEERKLVLDSLLLSCRVLGRGVEEAILAGMRRYAVAHALQGVEAPFIPTKKNAPALNFLETWPGDREEKEDGTIIFRRTVEDLPDGVPFGEFRDRTEPLPEEVKEEKESAAADSPEGKAEEKKERNEGKEEGAEGKGPGEAIPGWEINTAETEHLFHAFHYLPLACATGDTLLSLLFSSGSEEGKRAPYVPPGTPDELALAEIFGRVLRTDREAPVGMRDDFFALGGHSLTAVELLSRIHRHFRTEITLREIFENPTPAQLLERIRAGSVRNLSPILPLPACDFYELSHAQRRLWALDDIQSEGAAYVMGGSLLVEGELDADGMENAFRAVIDRHESLRTGIVLVEDRPMAKVFDRVPFSIERVDLSNLSLSIKEKEKRAREIAEAKSAERFDLSAPPLLRVTLLRLERDRHVLLLLLHHITADGWSYTVLLRELAALYRARSSDAREILPPLPIHYKEYAAWQRNELSGERGRRDEAFWLKRLAGPLPVLELPTDRPRPAQPDYSGGAVRVAMTREEAEAVRNVCREEGATLFMFLLASVRALLWRYAGARETVIGVPVAGRDHPDLADQIGFYVNTLALRGEVIPEESFAGTLGRVREEVLEAFAHRSAPFDLIVGKLEGVERDTGRSPVFDVMMALQNNREFDEEIEGLRFRPFGEEAGAGKFDLVFNFSEVPEGIECRLEYRTALFDPETVRAIGRELTRIAARAAAAPQESLTDIAVRFDRLREEGRRVAEAQIPEGTPIDLFRKTAERFPEKIAAAQGEREVTYRELEEASDRIAAVLAGEGVKKGDVVAVLLERGIELVQTMLGVMKRGALYLPIDPAYPEPRIRAIVRDSGAVLAVGRAGTPLPADCPGMTAEELYARAEMKRIPLNECLLPYDPAYVIYTSGSTGTPKGVCVEHRGFLNMITAQMAAFGVAEADTVLQFASPAFDASLSEIFMALLAGATLRIPERRDVEEVESFLAMLERRNVTVATIPPVYLRALDLRPMPTLRTLITAGEEAPRREVLHYARSMAVFNAYGPTECSVCATVHRVSAEGEYGPRIPIGGTISGVGAFVADDRLLPLPEGVPGELVLFGAGLAQGYLNDPVRTAERFVEPAWFGGTRCYRTGDRARQLPNGEFEFLGRTDSQVKIRGHRVEPEEARRGLLHLPGVRDAAVIVADDPAHGTSLTAFVCGSSLSPAALRESAARILPSFLLPQRVHVVEELPMTVNGKVDGRKLEELNALYGRAEGEGEPNEADEPRTEIEAALAEVFAEVLRLERVGIHENFFTLGGDSMKAIRVRAALGRRGYDLRSRHIFEGGSIAGIAPFVRAAGEEQTEETIEGKILPVPIQEWMAERLTAAEWSDFALPLVADAREPVRAAALRGAVLDLVNGHDALRMTAAISNGELVLSVAPRFREVPLQEFDLPGSGNDSTDATGEISSRIRDLSSGFPLDGSSPLFRAALLRGSGKDMIVLALHHLATDAVSLEVLLEDLNNAYEARLNGAEYTVPRSPSVAAWGQRMEAYAESIGEARREEWRQTADRANRSGRLFEAGNGANGTRSFIFAIPGDVTAKIVAARRTGTGTEHVLLAALRRTVAELGGVTEPAVMMESHGRDADIPLDISRTVGWFTAVYPLHLSAGYASVREELHGIRAALAGLKGREAEYGALRYRSRHPELRRALAAAPQIAFNYLGEFGGERGRGARMFEHTGHQSAGDNRSLCELELHSVLEEGEIKVRCTCGPSVPGDFADRFADAFTRQVREIAATLERRDHIAMRLVCLPWVGGDARSFEPLAAHLPSSIEIVPLELPGRGERRDEAPPESVEEIVRDVMEQLSGRLDLPYALFGHSMGGLLAFETARRIREAGLPEPEMLICAGAAAPKDFARGTEGKEEGDEEMIAAFYSDGAARSEAERERLAAAARADLRAVRSYRYAAREPLTVPVALLYGSGDDIPMEKMEGWREETAEDASFRQVEGGHDFPVANPAGTAAEIMRVLKEIQVRAEA